MSCTNFSLRCNYSCSTSWWLSSMLKTLRAYFSRVFRGRAPLWFFFFSPELRASRWSRNAFTLSGVIFFFTSSSLAERKKIQDQLKSRVRLIWLHDSSQTKIKNRCFRAKKLTHYGRKIGSQRRRGNEIYYVRSLLAQFFRHLFLSSVLTLP